VINAEGGEGPKQKRSEHIRQNDEIHPLHWYLLSKTVIWKNDPPPTIYVDRIGRQVELKDMKLKAKFDRWIGERVPVGSARPNARPKKK
jgi:hypothetical protein